VNGASLSGMEDSLIMEKFDKSRSF